MTESLITISLVGLIVGFIFSMPIAGPISILITSNALKGRLRYCHRATIGASFADFVFVFIAVFGITKLYSWYKPFIPYILLIGAFFLLYVGYKIYKTVVDFEHIDEQNHLTAGQKKDRGGFRTGFMISFLNPTLFLSWMTSSFFIITLVASWGFNTGGLDKTVSANYSTINKIEKNTSQTLPSNLKIDSLQYVGQKSVDNKTEPSQPSYFPLLLSLCYAFFLALGSIIWFYYLALFLAKFRQRINVNIINRIIHVLGFVLCLFGLFLGYKAITMFI